MRIKRIIAALVVAAGLLVGGCGTAATSAPSNDRSVDATTADSSDQVTQDYWYCWDDGDPAPHHLGYPVDGDHLCTDGELQDAGMTP